jgi:PDZ domain-containing secreted protein
MEFTDSSSGQEYLDYYNIDIPSEITKGFYINSVVAGSTLDGLVEPGDIIIQIGDIEITNTSDFVTNFSSRYRVGDIIDIIIYHNGSVVTLTDVELKAKPEA